MFPQKLQALLQAALPVHSCRSVHRLASLQELAALPPQRKQRLLYPFSGLEAYLDRSVDRTPFQLFQPDLEGMAAAERLFRCSPSHRIEYVASAERMAHAPALKAPEVCFIGRSNVGKSSLIRSLFALVPELQVRVSKTPGHTKKMNFFRVGGAFTVVDMPGYGYRAPRDFVEMVEPYLFGRRNLVRTFLLVDGLVGLQDADLVAVQMCEEIGSPFAVVVTKVDKGGSGVLLSNLLHLQEFLKARTSRCFPQPFLTSALDYSGIHLLRCFLAHVTGSVQLRDTSPC
ncbi:GTP-binding protein 8 [Oryzias melastigma]|uniref:GTP-binding protein 8 n=1 Tax=Oryzias melastigma TaxID=30732 RepID=A0A3B3DT03_ORYME|nr:GTP-binding protein 8 [Oryzias melastigma]XP_036065642.1 GTP-binding protein 8 [Oryzias melastigma]